MNKAEIVEALQDRLGGKQSAADALDAVIDTITRAVVKGEKVTISGFGSFEKAVRNARTGRNPRTGEKVRIKKTSVPRFRAGTSFKTYVADPKSLPKPFVSPTGVVRAATTRGAATAAKTAAANRTATKTATKAPARATKATATKAPATKATRAPAKTAAKTTAARSTATKAPTPTPAKKASARRASR